MNFLFLTQSGSLSLFYDLGKAVSRKAFVGKLGFYISYSTFFHAFEKENPEISSGSFELLKEWELIEMAAKIKPDIAKLKFYEKKIGDPVLWDAIVADRHIYFGKKTTMEQDYRTRFTQEQMLAILQVSIEEMEAFFDRLQPNVVIGFICVTVGEYLAYLIARSRNIKFLNLRPTRVRNYFYAGESVRDPSAKLVNEYTQMVERSVPEPRRKEAIFFLEEVRRTHAMYEGVSLSTGTALRRGDSKNVSKPNQISRKLDTLRRKAGQFFLHYVGRYRYDNCYPGIFYPIFFNKVKRPVRMRLIERYMKRRYVGHNELELIDYAFFPLNKEPEVALLVHSRCYLNQIEVARNVAKSLPVGMKLLVKEHPGGQGYHPLSFYRKLLAIPNVVLAPPQMESRKLVEKACLIALIRGSIGFEALIMKRPVIHFGYAPFGMLPDSMVRHNTALDRLSWEIRDLLENHMHDEGALIAYVAAVMELSVAVDFYSVLLGRQGVYRPGSGEHAARTRDAQIQKLAEYLLQCIS